MTTFDERESAFENKFAHDADMQFKAEAVRNRMIASWASELMGRSVEEAAHYAKIIIRTDFESPGPDDVIKKIVADLDGLADEATVRAKMQEFFARAQEKVLSGDPG